MAPKGCAKRPAAAGADVRKKPASGDGLMRRPAGAEAPAALAADLADLGHL